MAIALEDANKVWQRVNIALANARPDVVAQFAALKRYLAQDKRNPTLQFVAINNTSIDDSGGQAAMDAPCKLHGLYLKKAATATDVYVAIFDDAANDAGGDTDHRISLPFQTASEVKTFIDGEGLALAAGCVVKAYTDATGTTDSTDTDCPSGFAILGAA
jgi:hypothetical protein